MGTIKADTPLTEIARMPGVADLMMPERGHFAKALQLEAQGEHTEAEARLEKAVEAEAARRA